MKISLLVIRCHDIEVSKAFYERLGLHFQKEKHGKGLEHYSCEYEDTVFELYPKTIQTGLDNIRIGFKVTDINLIISQLEILSSYEFAGNKIYVVLDPDGRKVEISE